MSDASDRAAHILLVDASDAHAIDLRSVLEANGYNVSRADSVERAKDMLSNGIPELIIADFQLASVDCRDFARWLRLNERTRGVPFMLVTADKHIGEQEAIESGVDVYVHKSRDYQPLLVRIRALVRSQLTVDEAQRPSDEPSSEGQALEQFRILVDGVTDYALYMLDPAGRVSTWNSGAERIKGYQADEIIGKHVSHFYSEDDRNRGEADRALRIAREEGRYETESQRVRKDGTHFWAHVVIDPIFTESGALRGYAKITRDITELKAATDQLQEARSALMHSQKMEAIGQLTGGIAHDFNNMLAGIIGALNLVKRRIEAQRYDEAARFIEAAQTAANRAASLTSRLLAFGRRQSLDIKPINVNASISSMRILLDHTMGRNIAIETRFDAEELWASTDVSQLESAILNLAINARDAMPDGGALSIETRSVPATGNEAPMISVSVRDSGTGMAPEVLANVFEPFFTTKPIGQGTGLGLSMVYGFVNQSGGNVQIDSEVGKGTAVTLFLPRSSPAVAVEQVKSLPSLEGGVGRTVLVVEDDPQVRMLILEVLRDLGYLAIEASNSEQALAALSSHRDVDLMVSDVGLPGMNGRQLAEIARSSRPTLKILFMTGYAAEAAVRREFLEPGMEMLTKPFQLEGLIAKVQEMLNAT